MASFMLEQSKGGKWDSKTSELRFESEKGAEAYVGRITAEWGITDAIRVVPSDEAPNCKMGGGLGARHLVQFEPKK